jgi:PASTA domain
MKRVLGYASLATMATIAIASVAGAQNISSAEVLPSISAKASTVTDIQSLMDAAPIRIWREGDPVIVKDDLDGGTQLGPAASRPPISDPLVSQSRANLVRVSLLEPVAAASVVTNYDGIGATGNLPPDPVGAVGPHQYIQMVNSELEIYDKSGNRLAGPAAINSLWKGFGGPCETANAGDPVVLYDQLADRWLVSQFQLDQFMQCVAISRGSDPTTSGWFLYAFPTVDAQGHNISADYPKLGLWPDGYYMSTQRGFPSGGVDVWVFEREKMLAGQPARQIQFSVAAPSIVLQPSDLKGPPPPAGTPNFFSRPVDGERFGGQDRIEIYAFSTNWANPTLSTFKKLPDLPTTQFNSILCDTSLMSSCVPQPGTNIRLETLAVWPMYPTQYRNFGTHEVLLLNHTVNVDGQGHAGIRWYELRRSPGGAWSIYQQSTHAPDSEDRWMGSIAMDQAGNIALAYSVSSKQTYPSLRVATRHANDAPGTLGPEVPIVLGGGSQTYPVPRWGDYTSFDIDPAHPCAFWFTGPYYKQTSDAAWSTRIAEVQISGFTPDCGREVPNLSALTRTQAVRILAHDGITLGDVKTLPPEAGPGKLSQPVVVQQSIDPGTPTDAGSRVSITVQQVPQ